MELLRKELIVDKKGKFIKYKPLYWFKENAERRIELIKFNVYEKCWDTIHIDELNI